MLRRRRAPVRSVPVGTGITPCLPACAHASREEVAMPQASVVSSSSHTSSRAAPPFTCTSRKCSSATWIQAAGKLDLAASLELRRTLREARASARLVVLDLRELTAIDSSGVEVILDAPRRARQAGRRLMLVRGPLPVDRVLTLNRVSSQVLMFDLDPGEPSAALLE